jgi:asparagine synthase (glutamine-hydrolysing)
MCGIYGLICSPERYEKIDKEVVLSGFKRGHPRGPEDEKFCPNVLGSSYVHFGFHRLSINGLNTSSNQPLIHQKEKVAVICNGEIYNYKQLFEQHKDEFTAFSNSDCEIILHLYLKYGAEEMLQMIDGVFAFMIIDLRDTFKERVVVARDPYGVRPMFVLEKHFYGTKAGTDYFNPEPSVFAFASEAKQLYELYSEGDSITQFSPGNYQVFELKRKWDEFIPPDLPAVASGNPMYHTNFYDSSMKYRYFINTPYSGEHNPRLSPTEEDYLIGVRTALEDAVRKRVTTTERPIACLLSGGLDSSLITSLVAKNVSDVCKLETFSIGMPGSVDLQYARKVAEHLGTNHHEIVVSEDDMFNAIPEVIRITETWDTTSIRASVGNFLVAKYIAEHSEAKVIFNGDGSDEVTGGYLYFRKAPGLVDFDIECRRLLADIHMFDVLRSDRSISSQGLEARTPFLDKNFVDEYLSVPVDMRFNAECEKRFLRRAFDGTGLLPDEVLWRKKEAFSDGVSKDTRSWYEVIQEKVKNETLSNIDWDLTMEQNYYLHLFRANYNGIQQIIPYYWMPKFVDAKDSSARTLNFYED